MGPLLSRRVAVEALIAAVVSLVLALLVLLPLLGQLDNAWFGGDMLSQYDTTRAWNGFGFAWTDQVGFPFGQDRNAFPTTDVLNNAFTHVISMVTGSTFIGVNALVVVSFPLVAALALLAIRMTGLGGMTAVALAVAFSQVPYHWGRAMNHAYLSTMVSMVAGLILVLLVSSGRWQRAVRIGSRRRRFARIALVGALCLVVAWCGIYYAVFTLILGVGAIVWRAFRRDGIKAIAIGAAPFVGVIVLVAIALIPSLVAARQVHGDVVVRESSESVKYAGSILALLLPGRISVLPAYSTWADGLFANSPGYENVLFGAFGTVVTTACLLVFVGALIWRAIRRQPLSPAHRSGISAGLIAYLIAICVAFFIPWGPNYLVSMLLPQIRSWNRLTPALLLLFILAAAVVMRGTSWETSPRKPLYTSVAIILMTVIGVIAPIRIGFAASADDYIARTAQARGYASKVNATIPGRCGVLQLPVVDFPEAGTSWDEWLDDDWGDYEHLLVSLTNTDKAWSYGAMKNTSAAAWQQRIGLIPSEQDYEFLGQHGFCGIHVDFAAYDYPAGQQVRRALTDRFGQPVVVDENGSWALWALGSVDPTARMRPGGSAPGPTHASR